MHAAQETKSARRRMKLASALAACVGFLPGAASPFQPLVTDDTGTQGTGGNQIEVAYNHTVDKAPGTREVTRELPLVYTRGITDSLDLYVGMGYLRIAPQDAEPQRGLGNAALGAKWRFYENEAGKLSFALKPEVLAPVSSEREARGLGTAKISYGTTLIATRETGFGAVHANLAVERVRYEDDALNSTERRTLWRLSVAPVWDVTDHWKLALDAGVMTNPDRAERASMGYIEVGAIYSPTKQLDLAAGVVRNLRDGETRTTLGTVGLTWRF
jgi:Putative MetA-pathway of phenol degradation